MRFWATKISKTYSLETLVNKEIKVRNRRRLCVKRNNMVVNMYQIPLKEDHR